MTLVVVILAVGLGALGAWLWCWARAVGFRHEVDALEQSLADERGIQVARAQDYGALTDQVRSLAESEERLRGETGKLVNALRAPTTRGRWGEIQLRRVVEMAGMVPHCDFVEQPTGESENGRLRP